MTPAQRLQRARELLTRVSASPELKVAFNDRLPMTLDLDPLQVAARVLTPFQVGLLFSSVRSKPQMDRALNGNTMFATANIR